MAKKSLTKSNVGGREVPVAPAPAKPTGATAKVVKTEAAPAKSPAAKSASTAPTREEIARRAYEIYMGRGQAAGRELEDWAQAERELSTAAHRNN